MYYEIKKMLDESNLTRMGKVQVLSQLTVDTVNLDDAVFEHWLAPLLDGNNFPMSSMEFRKLVIAAMPTMSTEEGMRRKSPTRNSKIKGRGNYYVNGQWYQHHVPLHRVSREQYELHKYIKTIK